MTTVGKLLNWTLALTCVSAFAVDTPKAGTPARAASHAQTAPSVDNTKMNERDKDGAANTPQTQPNNAQDRELLAAVRRAIVEDKSLSTMAHNVKIVVEGGTVTLRGPVQSAEEKTKLESLVKRVKGITKTDNQLDVKTNVSSQ